MDILNQVEDVRFPKSPNDYFGDGSLRGVKLLKQQISFANASLMSLENNICDSYTEKDAFNREPS